MNGRLTILTGDCRELLKTLPAQSVQCCVTSPPYFGLRDYQCAGQIGIESTPAEFVEVMVEVFREVWRVLKDDGTLWLNLGDSYAGSGRGGNPEDSHHQKQASNRGSEQFVKSKRLPRGSGRWGGGNIAATAGLKPKDLLGIPWRVAFALQAEGWFLRSEITWCKRAPMPESVQDRPNAATEKIFLLTKSAKYFYDAEAVRNPASESFKNDPRWKTGSTEFNLKNGHSRRHAGFNDRWDAMEREQQMVNGSNMRNYWLLSPENFKGSHFATFPTEVPKRCILAGSRPDDTVLDPFGGSGTTGKVALELGRRAVLMELNPEYVELIEQRCDVTPGMVLA